MADIEKIAEELSALTVIEAAELSSLLEEKWGVSAAAPVAVAAGPAAADAGEAAAEKEVRKSKLKKLRLIADKINKKIYMKKNPMIEL